jgi:hypothetical protein
MKHSEAVVFRSVQNQPRSTSDLLQQPEVSEASQLLSSITFSFDLSEWVPVSAADVNHLMHRWGQGHCRFTDGSVYEGEWVRDKRHGSGRMTLSDGTVYEGQWQDDKQHGTGAPTL